MLPGTFWPRDASIKLMIDDLAMPPSPRYADRDQPTARLCDNFGDRARHAGKVEEVSLSLVIGHVALTPLYIVGQHDRRGAADGRLESDQCE